MVEEIAPIEDRMSPSSGNRETARPFWCQLQEQNQDEECSAWARIACSFNVENRSDKTNSLNETSTSGWNYIKSGLYRGAEFDQIWRKSPFHSFTVGQSSTIAERKVLVNRFQQNRIWPDLKDKSLSFLYIGAGVREMSLGMDETSHHKGAACHTAGRKLD